MKRIFKQKPSPALIVAIAALSVSLVGTAFAGPIAEISLNKGEKKQIRKITRKVSNRVANRRITKRAPGLSVANANLANIANVANAANTANNATTANSAKTAESADSVAIDAPGVALAGVKSIGGLVTSWFNRLGGEPAIETTSPGVRVITFPGLDLTESEVVHEATLRGPNPGLINAVSSGNNPVIRTWDIDNEGNITPANRGFNYTVFGTQ